MSEVSGERSRFYTRAAALVRSSGAARGRGGGSEWSGRCKYGYRRRASEERTALGDGVVQGKARSDRVGF